MAANLENMSLQFESNSSGRSLEEEMIGSSSNMLWLACTSQAENDVEESWAYGLMGGETNHVYKQIVHHFQLGANWAILALIPQIAQTDEAPPFIRFLIGCTLFRIGRIGGALREISLAIELESDHSRKKNYISELTLFLRMLGMSKEIIQCFGEVVYISSVEHALTAPGNSSSLAQTAAQHKIELAKILSSEIELPPTLDPLHTQVVKYLEAEGVLSEYSLSRDCISILNITEQVSEALSLGYIDCSKSQNLGPLELLVDAIKIMGPHYLLGEILTTSQTTMEEIMLREKAEYPDIDYTHMSSSKVVSKLRIWGTQRNNSVVSICSLVIKHRFIKGYFHFYNRDYEKSAIEFRWCYEFFRKAGSGLLIRMGTNNILSEEVKRAAQLYFLQSYCFSGGTVKLGKLVFEITRKWTPLPGYTLEWRYFQILGFTFESLAKSKAKYYDVIDGDVTYKLAKLDQENLIKMLFKYASCTCDMESDNPMIVFVFDRIIWGLIMHGGIHLNTLWFFLVLRDHFFIVVDFCPLQLTPPDDFRCFDKSDAIGTYSNGWEFVDKTYELSKQLVDGKEKLWLKPTCQDYMIPKVFVLDETNSDPKFVILAGEDEEESDNTYYFVGNCQIKLNRTCLRKNKAKTLSWNRRTIELSRQLVLFWAESYLKKHTSLPEVIEGSMDEFFSDIYSPEELDGTSQDDL